MTRSFLEPWYNTVDMVGQKRSNSLTQLGRVERGARIMKGPRTPFSYRWDRKPIVWICMCDWGPIGKLGKNMLVCN